MMNKPPKTVFGIILLSVFCLTLRIGMAEGDDASTTPDELPLILQLGPPRLTEEYIIVPIKTTGPIHYRKPILLKSRDGIPMVVYVSMPGALNATNPNDIGNSIARLKVNEFFNPPIDLPVSKVVLSQFRLEPPMSRIVFYVKEEIEPVIVAEGDELLFQFPLTTRSQNEPEQITPPSLPDQEPQITAHPEPTDESEEQTEQVDPSDGKMPFDWEARPRANLPQIIEDESPAPSDEVTDLTQILNDQPSTLVGVDTVWESLVTRVNLSATAPLKIGHITWTSDPEVIDGEVLKIHLLNTSVSEALHRQSLPVRNEVAQREIFRNDEGIIRRITVESFDDTPPSCALHIRLTRQVFYEVIDMKDDDRVDSLYELHVVFENPPLSRIVTVHSENEELRKLLFILFEQYGASFIADDDFNLDAKVTFHLENVPLKVVLDQILESRGYGYKEVEYGILRIMPVEKLKPPEQPKATPLKVLSVRTYQLKHALVANVKTALENFKSPEGQIISDERTRTIVLMDTEEHLAKIDFFVNKVIQTLDQEVAEEIVEPKPPPPPNPIQRVILLNYADPNQIKDILTPYLTPEGIMQPFSNSMRAGGSGGGTGSSGSVGGGSELGQAVGEGGYLVVIDIPETVIAIENAIAELDVPIPQVEIQVHIIESILASGLDVGVDWTGVDEERDALFSVGPTGGQLQIGRLNADEFEAVLRAVETKSNTRLLANPHITVVENQTAQFHSGDEIPFRKITVDRGVQQTEFIFKNVGIVLTVRVQVKTDDRINLLINAQVSSIGELAASGEPSINTRNARTQMLIPNGDTVTIGGLTDERTEEIVTRVPILGHIPLLGGLFRSRSQKKTLKEITIYLTPTIVQE
ncbi:type II secretion system protein GspD [Candidatus Poribacteria bacterium]|nr:type II secretion system protein GspD [Candidatus Poribacteria bacterium]